MCHRPRSPELVQGWQNSGRQASLPEGVRHDKSYRNFVDKLMLRAVRLSIRQE